MADEKDEVCQALADATKATVRQEPNQESTPHSKMVAKTKHLGVTTATQKAYRIHTRKLIAKLDKILPRNPLMAQLVGESRSSKTCRTKNVILGDLVDFVQKIRMDEVAVALAEKHRKKQREVSPTPETRAFRNVGVLDAQRSRHVDEWHQLHAPPPSSLPSGRNDTPKHLSVRALNQNFAETRQNGPDTSFFTSLPLTGPINIGVDHSLVLGGGRHDAEILAWLREESTGSPPAQAMGGRSKRSPPPSTADDRPANGVCLWDDKPSRLDASELASASQPARMVSGIDITHFALLVGAYRGMAQ